MGTARERIRWNALYDLVGRDTAEGILSFGKAVCQCTSVGSCVIEIFCGGVCLPGGVMGLNILGGLEEYNPDDVLKILKLNGVIA